jgi:hypothetical protein
VLIVFAFVASRLWQVASCEIANYELKDDLKDIASMSGARIGLAAQQSPDDELRATVIRKAAGRFWMPGMAVVFRFTASSAG